MAGAVVNCVNFRLNASTIAFLLDHSSAEVVMVDQEFFSPRRIIFKNYSRQEEKRIQVSTPNCHR